MQNKAFWYTEKFNLSLAHHTFFVEIYLYASVN